MSSDKGNSGNNSGPSGSVGDSSDGEEQEESSSSASDLNLDNVNDVLANFRQQWQRELQISPKHKGAASSKKKAEDWTDGKNDDVESRAKALFLKGAELERTGKLYEAIQFYKRAVQLVPDIELKLYESSKTKPRVRRETVSSNDEYNDSLNLVEDLESDDEDVLPDTDLYARFQRKVSKHHCVCLPQYEQRSAHISSLPMEIILYILRWVVSTDLDLRSLEMCARVCRGFYICTRDTEIWRLACAKVWGINCGTKPDPYLSWRNMFIERARLHFNGCYISKTTYIRHGENSFQDQFYRPWHIVEYYRYLRFFPEGKVLMLTTPEDPAQCISHLRYRNPRHGGVLSGHYRIRENTVTLLVQRHDIKNTSLNYKLRGKRKDIPDHAEQSFHLELQISNHHKRKHVQLTWLRYSVFTRNRNGTESTSTFDLVGNRFPTLWFSRVKSYTLESDGPLQ